MPYENQVENVQNSHVITHKDIVATVCADSSEARSRARDFVREYGASDKKFIRSLVVPFRPDPYGEGRPMTISHGNARREPSNYHPRRGNGKAFAKYEKQLNESGLSQNMATGAMQHIIIAKDVEPPLQRNYSAPLQCENKFGIPMDGPMRSIPIVVHERDVPEWTLNDAKVCAYLRHRVPGAWSHPGHSRTPGAQKRAHRKLVMLCAVIYMWYRVMMPAKQIAEELNIEVDAVIRMAQDARDHYPLFEANNCGCKNRSSRVRLAKAA